MSRIVCNDDLCIGCLACVVTCMDHHYGGDDPNAVSCRKYAPFDLRRGLTIYLTSSCRHCEFAPCIDSCPVGAILRDSSGMTKIDRSACVGCRNCLSACPYDAPVFDAEGISVRCDLCGACIDICANGALRMEE